MTELLVKEFGAIRLPFPELTDDEFFDFCAADSDYRIERTSAGRIVVMPGTGGKTANRNAELTSQLHVWAKRDRRGIAFDSSTMFLLPNRAMRSPDGAWVHKSRLKDLDERQEERFLPLCPEFVVELTSPSDRLPEVEENMAEWIANGARLGWILHPARREVHIYRPKGIEVRRGILELQGEGPVEGFTLDLTEIWDPIWK